MTLEYILLLGLFVTMIMGTMMKGLFNAFEDAGPKLAARIERHLITGDKFPNGGSSPLTDWKEK